MRRRLVLGDDAGGEAGGLLVRDRDRLVEVVDERRSSPSRPARGRSPTRGPSGGRRAARRAGSARSVRAPRARSRAKSASSAGTMSAASRSTSARFRRLQTPSRSRLASASGERLLARRGAVDVEDAAALGVRERPDAVLRGEPRERGGRLAAPAQDDERDQARAAMTSSRAPSRSGERTSPTAPGGSPARLERRAQDVVDERRDRARAPRRRCAGPPCSGS